MSERDKLLVSNAQAVVSFLQLIFICLEEGLHLETLYEPCHEKTCLRGFRPVRLKLACSAEETG